MRSDFKKCLEDETADGLQLEAHWMWILLSLQLVTTIIFAVWRVTLMSYDKILETLLWQ